jgi:hypothetical protein
LSSECDTPYTRLQDRTLSGEIQSSRDLANNREGRSRRRSHRGWMLISGHGTGDGELFHHHDIMCSTPHPRLPATTIARPFCSPPPRRHPATLFTGHVLAFAYRRDLGNSIFHQIASCLVVYQMGYLGCGDGQGTRNGQGATSGKAKRAVLGFIARV